jgi:hypothetical protein
VAARNRERHQKNKWERTDENQPETTQTQSAFDHGIIRYLDANGMTEAQQGGRNGGVVYLAPPRRRYNAAASPESRRALLFLVETALKPLPARPAPTRPSTDWSKERIAGLVTADIAQLRRNAERLNDPDVVSRCDQVMGERKAQERAARAAARKSAQAGPGDLVARR